MPPGNGKPFNGEGSKSAKQMQLEQASEGAYRAVQDAIEKGHGPKLTEVLQMISTLMNQRETRHFQKDGKVTETRTVLCIPARIAGVRMGMEIHNLTGRLKLDVTGSMEHKVEHTFQKKDLTRLKNAIKRIKKKDSGRRDPGNTS